MLPLQFKLVMLDDLYSYARVLYDCGNYARAAETLYIVRALAPVGDKKVTGAMWGKLASEILMQNWDVAMDDLIRLKEHVESQTGLSPLEMLQQRTSLLHWSLFIFFNHQKGKDHLIEWFLVSQP